jgi:hypothetical protein
MDIDMGMSMGSGAKLLGHKLGGGSIVGTCIRARYRSGEDNGSLKVLLPVPKGRGCALRRWFVHFGLLVPVCRRVSGFVCVGTAEVWTTAWVLRYGNTGRNQQQQCRKHSDGPHDGQGGRVGVVDSPVRDEDNGSVGGVNGGYVVGGTGPNARAAVTQHENEGVPGRGS